jgi:hypothetical protein
VCVWDASGNGWQTMYMPAHALLSVVHSAQSGRVMKKPEKSERLVVQVEPQLKKQLERYSEESGVPMSEFCRRAVVEALKRVQVKK